MAYSTADFHYLTILRELEKETTRLERRRKSSERGQAHRTSRVFRDLFGELSGKVAGDSITLKLKASGEKLLETELASADLIRDLDDGAPPPTLSPDAALHAIRGALEQLLGQPGLSFYQREIKTET